LQKAINFYREALDYYKRSIDLNPHEINAKYNHEFVEKELKALLDKLKHQKSSSKGKKGSNNKSSHKESKATSSGQKNREKKKGASPAKKKKQKGGAKKEKAMTAKAKQLNANSSSGRGDKKEMSEKEARMILNRYSEEEFSHNSVNKTKSFEYPAVDKDW